MNGESPVGGSGYDYHRSTIGDHEGGLGFFPPIQSAIGAWWKANGGSADPSWLRADLEAATRGADRSRHDPAYIETRVADLDSAIRAIGASQAGQEAGAVMVPTFTDAGHVSLEDGERLASEMTARFMAKVRGWHNWPGEQIAPGETAPCELLKATLGLGKTALICDLCAEVPPDRNVNVYAPNHALVIELAERIVARVGTGHRVVPIYGREQMHPDGVPMCPEIELAREVSALNLSVERSLCKKRVKKDGKYEFQYCIHHPEAGGECRYQLQKADNEPAIRVAPHAYLAIGAGNPLPDIALNLIDEDPSASLIRDDDNYGLRLDLIKSPCGKHDDDRYNAAEYSKILHDVLAAHHPTPAKLRAAGIDSGVARFMIGQWYQMIPDLKVTPGMERQRKINLISTYKAKVARKLVQLWELIGEVIDLEVDELRSLRIEEITKNDKTETMVMMVWSIDPKIIGPTLICDGTADDEIIRRFFPNVEIATINVKAVHYHAIQVIDQPVSKKFLGYNLERKLKNPNEAAERESKKVRADLARMGEVLAAKVGGAVLMSYKLVAEALRAEHPRLDDCNVEIGFQRLDGKWAGHHGAERGFDRWKSAAGAIIAGRHLPPRVALERRARAIFYRDPRPMTYQGDGFYELERRAIRMADGTGRSVMNETHADPLVRRVLDQAVRATAEQEAHRLRLIRRTAETAPLIIVATNAATDLTVHEVITWKSLVPNYFDVIRARGVVPADRRGQAQVAGDMLEEASDPADTLATWFRKNPGVEAGGWITGEFPSDLYKKVSEFSIRVRRKLPWKYRRRGERQFSTVYIDISNPDAVPAPADNSGVAASAYAFAVRAAGLLPTTDTGSDPEAVLTAALNRFADPADHVTVELSPPEAAVSITDPRDDPDGRMYVSYAAGRPDILSPRPLGKDGQPMPPKPGDNPDTITLAHLIERVSLGK